MTEHGRDGMFEDDVTVPAGWYPDPMGLPQLRWWDNHAWTELTSEARPPLVMQTPTRFAYADEEIPTRRQQREQRERDEQHSAPALHNDDVRGVTLVTAPLAATLRQIEPPIAEQVVYLDEQHPLSGGTYDAESPDDDVIDDDAIDESDRLAAPPRRRTFDETSTISFDTIDYDSVGDASAVPLDLASRGFAPQPYRAVPTGQQAPDAVEPGHPVAAGEVDAATPTPAAGIAVYTGAVWIIALIPLLLLVLSLLLLLGFGSSLSHYAAPSIWLASWLAVIVLAFADRAALGRLGYKRRASWIFAVFSAPVYLIARSMTLSRVGPLGFAPVLVWVALGMLQIGSVLVVPGLIISAMPAPFTAQAERSIASDSSIIGEKLAVSCVEPLPVLIGQAFHCNAIKASGESFTVAVSLERANGWVEWHVDDWGAVFIR